MIKGEACDLVARPEAENSGEASFHPWPGRMFTGTWSKGFRSVPRSTLGWWRAPPLPLLGQPWILSRSHLFHVIVTAKSVVVTRVRADKPCNVAAAYRTGPTARLRWKQTALLYSWLSTLAQIITHFVELASQIPRISTPFHFYGYICARTRGGSREFVENRGANLSLSMANISIFVFVEKQFVEI